MSLASVPTSLLVDAGALAVSIVSVVVYQARVRRRLARDPDSAMPAVVEKARAEWVAAIMASGRDGILAVQTLRNSVMAASFMASTAVLLIIGTLTLSSDIGKLSRTWHAFVFEDASTELWLAKVLLLVAVFFLAFVFSSFAVRLYHHVAYLICVPPHAAQGGASVARVADYLNQAGRYYGLSLRCFLYSLPVVFWFFGAPLLLVGTGGLIWALSRLDHVPPIRVVRAPVVES